MTIVSAQAPTQLAAKLFRGFADPTRMQILLVLQAGERRVTDLMTEVVAPRPTSPGTWPA